MSNQTIACPECGVPMPCAVSVSPQAVRCPGCQAALQAHVFPALFRRITPVRPDRTMLLEGEASCFYHPHNQAVLPCSACGRFLCALCDVELGDQHMCPNCLETGRKKGKLTSLETRRVLHDSAALSLALLPVVLLPLWFLAVVTAPLALFLAIYSWFKPTSIIPRTRLRSYVALLLALLELGGVILLVYFAVTRSHV